MLFFIPPKCGHLFNTLYLLDFPTYENHKVLNHEKVGAKDYG